MAKKELQELQNTCTKQKSYYIVTVAKSTATRDGQERTTRVTEYLYRTEGQYLL